MTQPPADYSDPLHGIPGATNLPHRPVVASVPVTGAIAAPDQPVPVRDYPGRTYGRTPTDAYPDPPSANAPWPLVTGEAPRPRRRALGIMIAILAVLGLGAGVAVTWVTVSPTGVRGTATPEQAVDGFLTGIYETRDARAAGRHVCERARDDAELDRVVFAVKQHEEAFTAARTTWSTPTIEVDGRQATAEVTLTMTTINEQVATRAITLLLVDDRGWWVCDVRTD